MTSLHDKKVANQKMAKEIQTLAQQDLLPNISNKLEEVSKYIEKSFKNSEEKKGLTATKIYNIIASRSVVDIASPYDKSYTPQELAVAFNYYVKMMADINEYVSMPPDKSSFCLLLGICDDTYDNYLQDPERCDVMKMVETYIKGAKLTSAQLGETKEISTIFELKSRHGLVEAQAPTTIIHEKKLDVEDIRSQLAEMKRGKITEARYEEKGEGNE